MAFVSVYFEETKFPLTPIGPARKNQQTGGWLGLTFGPPTPEKLVQRSRTCATRELRDQLPNNFLFTKALALEMVGP